MSLQPKLMKSSAFFIVVLCFSVSFSSGEKFVFGSYFARPHETFCEPTRRFYKNEVFVTPIYDTLPLSAVVGRCLVLDSWVYPKGRPKLPQYNEADVYICEYRVDRGQKLFAKTKYR